MKWRVVGWATYDDRIEEGSVTWAVDNAIVDEVKKRGYLFSGWAHQEGYNCAPVMNDGKIRRFSQRGWGGVMAEAHGYTGFMDYSLFAFDMDHSKEIRPKDSFDKSTFKKEKGISECFEVEVSDSVLADAIGGEARIADLPELRYLDAGDSLMLRSGDKVEKFVVLDVDKEKDLPEDELLELEMDMHNYSDRERMRQAQEEYVALPFVIVVKLKAKK